VWDWQLTHEHYGEHRFSVSDGQQPSRQSSMGGSVAFRASHLGKDCGSGIHRLQVSSCDPGTQQSGVGPPSDRSKQKQQIRHPRPTMQFRGVPAALPVILMDLPDQATDSDSGTPRKRP
jgi:hypothetical protein